VLGEQDTRLVQLCFGVDPFVSFVGEHVGDLGQLVLCRAAFFAACGTYSEQYPGGGGDDRGQAGADRSDADDVTSTGRSS
jgi:hypothetical protein